jgi:hypothetical protein
MDLNDLSGPQRKVLRQALSAAFDENSMNTLLQEELNRGPLRNFVPSTGFDQMVFDLIALTQREGWTDSLVDAARSASNNSRLKRIESDLSILDVKDADKRFLARGSLERTVRERAGFDDIMPWITRLLQVHRQICRIEFPVPRGTGFGTGFLVANDLVLTNFHVVEPHIKGQLDPSTIKCRFDYAVESGREAPGTTIDLAGGADWIVTCSPYSKFDPGDQGGSPQIGELDFALLRLATAIGDQNVNGGKRGWISAANPVPSLAQGDIVFIVQHPEGTPQKLAVGSALAANANATRIRYDASTDGGSSGSPCFNAKLELVALHHGGDPNYFRAATFNQGIPLGLIVERMRNSTPPIAICRG